jgi:hypothetical protein
MITATRHVCIFAPELITLFISVCSPQRNNGMVHASGRWRNGSIKGSITASGARTREWGQKRKMTTWDSQSSFFLWCKPRARLWCSVEKARRKGWLISTPKVSWALWSCAYVYGLPLLYLFIFLEDTDDFVFQHNSCCGTCWMLSPFASNHSSMPQVKDYSRVNTW